MSIDGTSFGEGEQVRQDADEPQHTAEIIPFPDAKERQLLKIIKGKAALSNAQMQSKGPNKQSTLHGIFRERVAEIAKSDAERSRAEKVAMILAPQGPVEATKPPTRKSLTDLFKGLFGF